MEPATQAVPADPRVAALCPWARPGVFHGSAYRNDVWKEDPFDVETIHEEARAAFERLVDRASGSGASRGWAGGVLLPQGEAGGGKTPLLRAFRNGTHARGGGYFGYMQMTSATSH